MLFRAPEIRVVQYHGKTPKQRGEILVKIQAFGGVILTTYGLACTSASLLGENRHGNRFTWVSCVLQWSSE